MTRIVRDSACWALVGLSGGVIVALVVAVAMDVYRSSAALLVVLGGGTGFCLGPLALTVYRATQLGGASRIAYGGLWGAAWGFALGLLYWAFYDNTVPLSHLAVPMVLLAAAGVLNAALDVDIEASVHHAHSTSHRFPPAAK